MNRIALIALALLLAAVPAAAAPEAGQTIDNPEFANWKAFKVGTSITHRMTATSGPTTSKMETTTRLKAKSDDKLVLTYSTVTYIAIPGQDEQKVETPAQERTVPAKLPKMAPPKETADMPKPEIKEGEETLKILGKDYKCTWIQSTLELNGMKTTSKTWMSAQVPGQMVKMTSSTKGAVSSTSTTEVIALKTP